MKKLALRKAGYKFTIEFRNGKVGNVISTSQLAMDLAAVMLEDTTIKTLFTANNYEVTLNTRFQMSFKNCTVKTEVAELEEATA